MKFFLYVVAILVLVTLMATLMYVTKMIKAKDNKAEKTEYSKKAAIYFCLYLALNALRLYLER